MAMPAGVLEDGAQTAPSKTNSTCVKVGRSGDGAPENGHPLSALIAGKSLLIIYLFNKRYINNNKIQGTNVESGWR
jgi:hypothetical protein